MTLSNTKSLRIISFNCHSLVANQVIIESFIQECDILLLQETLLVEHDSWKIGMISREFDYCSVAATRKSDVFCGRSSGGLSILWRKNLNVVVEPLIYSSRIMAINLKLGRLKTLLINVYCPCDYRNEESLLNFRSCMADLSNILGSKIFDSVLIAGDFNSDPNKGRFFNETEALLNS